MSMTLLKRYSSKAKIKEISNQEVFTVFSASKKAGTDELYAESYYLFYVFVSFDYISVFLSE